MSLASLTIAFAATCEFDATKDALVFFGVAFKESSLALFESILYILSKITFLKKY